MSTRTCRTCRHWGLTPNGRDRSWDDIVTPIDEDTFEPKVMPFEVRYCTAPKLIRFERPVEPDQASCIDGSRYVANLATGPEYGCVHHEEAAK